MTGTASSVAAGSGCSSAAGLTNGSCFVNSSFVNSSFVNSCFVNSNGGDAACADASPAEFDNRGPPPKSLVVRLERLSTNEVFDSLPPRDENAGGSTRSCDLAAESSACTSGPAPVGGLGTSSLVKSTPTNAQASTLSSASSIFFSRPMNDP